MRVFTKMSSEHSYSYDSDGSYSTTDPDNDDQSVYGDSGDHSHVDRHYGREGHDSLTRHTYRPEDSVDMPVTRRSVHHAVRMQFEEISRSLADLKDIVMRRFMEERVVTSSMLFNVLDFVHSEYGRMYMAVSEALSQR